MNIGTQFTDNRDLTDWSIIDIEKNGRGTLYTVQNLYDKKQYKRHYATKLRQIARDINKPSKNKTVKTKRKAVSKQDDSNVVFILFSTGERFSNRDTWQDFYGL